MKTKRTLWTVLVALVLTAAMVLSLGIALNAMSLTEAVWGTDADNLTSEGSFREAIAAVNAGEASYVRLVCGVNYDAIEITKSVTIDMNGNDIEFQADYGEYSWVIDGEASVAIVNTYDNGSDDYDPYENSDIRGFAPVYIGATASLTIDGVYVDCEDEDAVFEYCGGKFDLAGIIDGSFVQIANKSENDVVIGDETIVIRENQEICTYDMENGTFSFYTTLAPEDVCIVADFANVFFDANGGEGTMAPTKYPVSYFCVLGNIASSFTHPDGLVFQGWTTVENGTQPEYYAGIYEDTTLYAVWGAPVVVGGTPLVDGQYLSNDGVVSAEKPAGGYAYYKDGVLTLNNYVYEGSGYTFVEDYGEAYNALIYVTDGVKVELQGENVLKSDVRVTMGEYSLSTYQYVFGIGSFGSVTITGEGSVEMVSVLAGAYVAKNITVESGKLVIDAVQMGLYADEGTITVKGGVLDIVAWMGYGICASEGNVVIEDGQISIYCGDDGISAETVTVNGGELSVVVGYNGMRSYGDITITGGTIDIFTINGYNGLYSSYGDIVIKGGQFNIVAEGGGIYASEGNVVIEDGQFKIIAEDDGICAYGDITIEGGQFEIEAGYDDGIYACGDLTIKGGVFEITAEDAIYSDGDIVIEDGQFKLTVESEGIYACYDLTIKGGEFNINSEYYGIYSSGNFEIEGGQLNIVADGYGIYGYGLTVTGGFIDIDCDNAIYIYGDVALENCVMVLDTVVLRDDIVILDSFACAIYCYTLKIDGSKTAIYYNGELDAELVINEEEVNAMTVPGAIEGKDVAHNWAEDYQYNEIAHWHGCTDEGCVVSNVDWIAAFFAEAGYGMHDDEAVCSVCGYEKAETEPEPDVKPEREIEIYVGGVGLVSGEYLSNSGVISTTEPKEGGYAYYEDDVLYLCNYVYEGAGAYGAAIYSENAINIYVIGENTLTCSSGAAIKSQTSGMYILGEGKNSVLNLNADYGIRYMDCSSFEIDYVTLNIDAKYAGICMGFCSEHTIWVYGNAAVNIKNALVGIKGYYSYMEVYGVLNIDAQMIGIASVNGIDVYDRADITVSGGVYAIDGCDFYNSNNSFVIIGAEYNGYGFTEIGNSDMYAKSVRIVSVNALLTSIDKDVEELNKLVAEGGTIDEINGMIAAINEKLAILNSVDAEINGKVEAVEGAVSAIEAAITSINEKLADVEANKESIAALTETVKTIQTTIATLGTAAEDERLAGLISSLETALDTLSDTLDEVTERLEAAEDKIEALEKDVEALNKLIAEGGTIEEINKAITAINEKLVALTAADTTINGKVEAVEGAVSAIEAAIATINAKLPEIDTNKASIATLNETVKTIQTALATLGTAAEDERLAGLIEALDTSLDTLSGALAEIEARLNGTEDKIADLEAALEASKAALAEKDGALQTFIIIVCVMSGVALCGSGAFVAWFFIDRKKRI